MTISLKELEETRATSKFISISALHSHSGAIIIKEGMNAGTMNEW